MAGMEKISWLIVYLFINSWYFWLRRRPAKYYFRLVIDNKIPLLPAAVIPYVSYFGLMALAFGLLFFSPYFLDFIRSMTVAQLLASLIWYFFPNGIIRPEIAGRGRTRNWVRRLHWACRQSGCAFPSAHTYHSLIIGVFLARAYPQWQAAVAVWSALIVGSTVLTKQHYAADVAGGMALSVLALRVW
jgi:membrane-associated phospholipid phosphatase